MIPFNYQFILLPFEHFNKFDMIVNNVTIDSKTDASVLTNFINLDGSVFSYVKLTFKSKTSNDAFRYFYDVTSTDGGLKSLDINGFEIITTNRDFDMNKISLLKNEFLDVDTQEDIIAKEGVNTKVYADLINDCLDYTFWRIVKSNKVYSKFEFEGPIKKTTVLSTTMNNFGIDSGITFSDSILQIIIDPENNSNAKLNLVGNFVLITEKDRAISLKSQWDFGSKPNSNITLSGRMLGIYDDVFKVGLIDLSEVKVSGIITSTGNLYEMSLNGLGIFGKNCYSQQELIKNLQSQDSSLKDTIYDLSLNKKNSDGSISVVKNNWKSAYFKVFINSADYSKNHIRGILKFDNSEDIFRTSLDVKSDDHIPQIINNIDFPYGLILDYAYTDSTEDRPMSFKGIMNFMGVNTQGQFNLHSWNNTAKANIILPTIKMGRGNFEFITHDDLFYKYGLVDNADNFDSRNLDIKTDYNSLTQNNTLKFKLERDSLASSQLLLESNIIIFGMVNRTITYLNSDLMSFSIIANPFKGVFNANTTIEVKPVKQIEQETNSVVQMNFTQNDEYFHLEQLTNDLMQEWVSRVIKVTKQAKFLISDYTNRMNQAKNSYTKENDWEVYEQCQNLPTIIWDEYAQQATCKKETTICLNMVQVCTKQTDYCTRTNSKGEWQQSIKKCDHWDTQCQDETTSKVWSEFESHDIPDHCLKMELVCSTTQQKDQEWVSKSREFEVFIRNTQQNIDDLNEFLKNIKQLRDSSVCALRNANDHTQVHKWNEKDLAIDAVLDNLDILDLVTLENVRADMQLDKVIAADQIIFGSDIWLYGDWTNKKLKVKDDLVIKNDVQIEEENIKEGYTNGAKSLITLYHHVDFNSIELTAREMAHEIEKIVCKEFNISNEISTKIQYSIIEFNLIDGNSTICPTYSELDLTPTSDGLYSDHREKVNAKKQNTGLNSYRYKYEEGRTSIDVTKERIDNMNTLAFQEKVNSQKEVSVVDAIVSNLDSKPIVPTIPVTEAATEFKINPDDKDTGSNRKDANSINTDSSMQATAEENNYANSVQEKQASIDEEKRRIAEEKLRIEEENKRLAEENRRQQEELRKQQVKRPQIN